MHSSRKSHRVSAILFGAAAMLAAAPVLAQSAAAPAAQPMADINQAQAAGLAARRDFAQFVQHNLRTRQAGLPDGFPLDINDIQDLQDASVGYGFQVYTLDPQDIVAGRAALHSMVKPTGVWRFIIRLHDRPIGLATVEQSAGAWTTVAYGGAVLSKDVDALMAFHGNAQRSNLRFVRVFQAQSDFLEVQSGADAKVRFAPLHSARESLLLQQRAQKTNGAGADGLLDAADILEPLRAAVKTNMDAFR